MSDIEKEKLELLRRIADKADASGPPGPPGPTGITLCKQFVAVVSAAVSFVIALAMNTAFQKTFELIAPKKNSIVGSWIYAGTALFIGLLLLWLIFTYIKCK